MTLFTTVSILTFCILRTVDLFVAEVSMRGPPRNLPSISYIEFLKVYRDAISGVLSVNHI